MFIYSIELLLFSSIESSNNQKLMLEYEKYQDLQAKTQKTQEEYERQITELENRKEEEVTRQRMQYTAQLEKLKNDLILVRFHFIRQNL
jgi:dsDNA-specific endonuclease/ATPase MutS2